MRIVAASAASASRSSPDMSEPGAPVVERVDDPLSDRRSARPPREARGRGRALGDRVRGDDGGQPGRRARSASAAGFPVRRASSSASRLSASRRARECSSRSAPARRASSLVRSSTSSSASAASPPRSSGTSRTSPPARPNGSGRRSPPPRGRARAAGRVAARNAGSFEEGRLRRLRVLPARSLAHRRATSRSSQRAFSSGGCASSSARAPLGTDARPPRRRGARARDLRHARRSERLCRGPPRQRSGTRARRGGVPAPRRTAPRAPRTASRCSRTRRAAVESLVERVADEHVREAQAAGRAGNVGDDASGHRLVEHVEQTRRPDTPRMRASASMANSRPSTDARTSSRSHARERWVSRRAITSRTLWGIASRASAADLEATPSTASRRTISPTKSGFPSVSSCSPPTSSGEAISDAVSST